MPCLHDSSRGSVMLLSSMRTGDANPVVRHIEILISCISSDSSDPKAEGRQERIPSLLLLSLQYKAPVDIGTGRV